MDYKFSDQGILVSLLKGTPKPIFLLGAGASKQSGIALASEMVEEIAKWGYCTEKGFNIEDPRVTISDWKKWLQSFDWYTEDYNDLYPIIVDKVLRPQSYRRQFFLKLMNPGIKASAGYEVIVELMHIGHIDTVLTTNFDECIAMAKNQIRKPYHINIIKTPFDSEAMLSTAPQEPQQVYLHGSVDHYTDQNLLEETKNLNSDLVRRLQPMLKDRPIIIIGYRGTEPSIMRDLFLNNLTETKNFHNGIYWCVLRKEYEKSREHSFSPLLKELATKVNRNFQFVEIDGFDEVMIVTLGNLKTNSIDFGQKSASGNDNNLGIDIQPVKENFTGTITNIEFTVIRDRLIKYCERLNIKTNDTDSWIHEQMLRLKIADDSHGHLELTSSGILLFSSTVEKFIPNAKTFIKFAGNIEWLKKVNPYRNEANQYDYTKGEIVKVVEGNILNQLNEITDLISLVNRPFRLKGEVSETVYPYPTLALKEIIVNCLVHRNYRINEAIIIDIYPSHITFKSPGGLIDEVKRQLHNNKLEDLIKNGRRGIKGYRNPILADLFYGSGAMDKEGSGLSDVVKKVAENSGQVIFDQVDEEYFQVTLFRRPEEINEDTSTATPLKIEVSTKYTCNLLEFISMPKFIYHASTDVRIRKQIWSSYIDSEVKPWIAPCLLFKERLWSFFDISEKNNILRNHVDLGTFEIINVDEFVAECGSSQELVKMLNEIIEQHLRTIGLVVDPKRKRAYFPKTIEGGQREITYHGRMKKATRTVAKARVNPTTGKIRYWEHKGIWFAIENIANNWYLMINPTYVFTTDGYKNLLLPKRVSALATKRASRDYNMHVHNDLTFWVKYLSNEKIDAFELTFFKELFSPEISIPEFVLSSNFPTTVVNDVILDDTFSENEFNETLENEFDLEVEKIINSVEIDGNKD